MQTGSPHLWGSNEPHVDENGVRRLRFLTRIACIWVFLIVARLFHLQILSHEAYKQLAQSQQQKVLEVRAPRGTIYGRSGEALAKSTSRWSVVLNPRLVPNAEMTAELLSQVLELDAPALLEKMKASQEQNRGGRGVSRRVGALLSEGNTGRACIGRGGSRRARQRWD